ncbi:MAG: ABC transporter substrate-binding protein [Gammaproteobacteria bacterium]
MTPTRFFIVDAMPAIARFLFNFIGFFAFVQLTAAGPAHAKKIGVKSGQTIHIAYLSQEQEKPAALSNLDPYIPNQGEAGAVLATTDNNTTGQFTKQRFVLDTFIVPGTGDPVDVFNKNIAKKYDFVLANLPPARLLQVADQPEGRKKLILDIASHDDVLRNQDCRPNILHLLPTRAMRADALAQYMLKKRWTRWLLVQGPADSDGLYADAIRRAARRFGIKIVEEKIWDHSFDARRTAQSVVPVFTQADEYDVLVVADEQSLFGEYLDYRTWLPRPVIGTQGLTAVPWHRTHEQWGAVQLQNRFKEQAGRWMEERDYAAYLAVRALGEAATRTRSGQLKPIKDYLLSDRFALQGYKGVPLSFRAWNGQMRQPVLLAAPRSMVAVAPIEGFLHPKTELDTLGYDQSESTCHWTNNDEK